MSSNRSGSSHKKANYVAALVAAWPTPLAFGFRFPWLFWHSPEMKSAENGNWPKCLPSQGQQRVRVWVSVWVWEWV